MKIWLISLLITYHNFAYADEKKTLLEIEIPAPVVTAAESVAETAIESALQPPPLKAMKLLQDWVCEDDGCKPIPPKKKMRHVRIVKQNATCKAWGFAGLCDLLGIEGELIREYDEEIK